MVPAKIYHKLLDRKRSHLDPLLRINQNGFCSGRSTLAQTVTFRRLIEGAEAKQLQAIITLADFSKAFDSIHREKLMEVLSAYGIPKKIADAINIL